MLVPLGATAQQNPHLPLETDTIIAVAVASGVRDLLDDTVVAPALAFGARGGADERAGAMSIGTETFTQMIVELVHSVSTWAGGILLVNGHPGNLSALAAAVPLLVLEGFPVAWVPCSLDDRTARTVRTETSVLRHLDPAAVDHPALDITADTTSETTDDGEHILAAMVEGVVRRLVFEQADARGCLTDPGAP